MSASREPGPVDKPRPEADLRYGVAVSLICLVAALLRIRASLGDLWFDEVWSLELARSVNSPLEILTGLHHFNNHILNTLYLYLLGRREFWPVYRLLSVIAGVSTVALTMLIARRRGVVEALIAGSLAALSFLFVVYSSEARGYALAVFLALVAFHSLRGYFESKHRGLNLALFFLASTCGFLAHLTFMHFYAAAAAWSAVRCVRTHRGGTKAFLELARLHAVPVLFFAFLYLVDIRLTPVVGGPKYPLPQVLGETVALALGAPATGPIVPIICLAGAIVFVAGLSTFRRERSDEWLFYAFVLIGSPALLLIIVRPEYVYARYFLVCLPFFILLLAHLLARCYRLGTPGKLLCATLLVSVCGGNIWRTALFLRDGRGHYLDALLYMAENTAGRRIELGSDSDFRTPKLLAFYAPYLPHDKQVHYYAAERWPPRGPEWLINHRQAPGYRPKREVTAYHGLHYVLQKEFRYSGISGFHWFVYRRKDVAPHKSPRPVNHST
jgi:uncharacterized membrane protein